MDSSRCAAQDWSRAPRVILPVLLLMTAALSCRAWGEREPPPAPQVDSLKELSLAELGDIEVTTPSKEPVELWKTPAATYVLTHEDIERSGATNIPEVLRLVPGVEVARIDANEWAISIRGLGNAFSRSVLVLIDGRSVYTPLFAGVYWDVQNVPLEDVDRIEVVRGPGGTIWGSNAVNGVINIITKDAKATHGTRMSVRSGNVDRGGGVVRHGGAHGSNFDYRVYGMGFGITPEYHSDNDNYDAWQLGQAGFRTDTALSAHDDLTVEGDLYKGEIGQRASVAYYSPPSQQNIDAVEHVSGGNLVGRWRHSLSETADLQVQGYYDRTYRLSPELGENRDTFDLDFVHHFQLKGRNDVTWGAGARWSPTDLMQTVPTVEFVHSHQTDSLYSTFIQDQIALIEGKVWLTLGSKFEHNDYTGWEIQPGARILYNISAHQSAWAAVTRAVRTPSRIDEDLQFTALVSQNPPTFFCLCGDGKFSSETLLGYEAGYRKLLTPKIYADFAAFHNRYNRLESIGALNSSSVSSPPPQHTLISASFANGVMGASNGGEVTLDWEATHWLEAKGAYSYVSLNFRQAATQTKSQVTSANEGSSPHHEVSGTASFTLPKGFRFSPTYRYVGNILSPLTPSYQTLDTQLSWHLAKEFQLSLTGQNLFQPRHAEFGPVLVERAAYAQITWHRETE